MGLRSLFCLATVMAVSSSFAATKTICVDVQVKSWTAEPQAEAAGPVDPTNAALATADQPIDAITGPELVRAPAASAAALAAAVDDPYAIDPARYLDRMVRYEVTHEPGFEAVDKGCDGRIVIELYPLRDGWTVFAHYKGTYSREEKVDQALLDEFIPLSRRVVHSLLRDMPIAESLTRDTVLRADSETDLRTIEGTGHFVLAFSGQFQTGTLPTANSGGGVDDARRWIFPKGLQLGYRGKRRAWGVDCFARGALGSTQSTPRANSEGGHVDLDGTLGLGLHVLRYLNSEGVTSFYWGGGAQFKMAAYSVIRPQDQRSDGDRESVFVGGIDAELLMGIEFARASSIHFYLQAELGLPTYLTEVQVEAGGIDTYMPNALFQVGLVF